MNKRFSALLFLSIYSISSHTLSAEPDINQGGSQSSIHPTAAELHQSNAKADNKNRQKKNRKKSKGAEAPPAVVVPQ